MSKPTRGLGKGLGALLGDTAGLEQLRRPVGYVNKEVVGTKNPQDTADVLRIPVDMIEPNPYQPRLSFDQEALQELAASIQAVGVIQPIIVCREGERYTIVAGERRYRAARLAGLEQIPAIVRDWEKQTRLEAALIENLQRDDLNPVEEAMGVKKLMEETGLTQEQAAQRLGKSRPAVANLLRLLTLPESVIRMLREGKLTAGHARALVGLEKGKQEKLAQLCAAQGWSVRQFEKICQAARQQEPEPKPRVRRDPQLKELESLARDTRDCGPGWRGI